MQQQEQQYQFFPIPTDSLSMFWPTVETMLHKCPETWQDYETIESIYDALSRGSANLALIMDGKEVMFAAIFGIRNYAATRTLHVDWCYGSGIDSYTELFLAGIETFAQKLKIDWVEFGPARPGFLKVFKPFGYDNSRVVFRKKIQEETLQ